MPIFEGLSNFLGQFITTLRLFMPILGMIIILIIVVFWVRHRKQYHFPISILSEREDGGTKERETRGAIISRKGSSPFFSIKVGWFKRLALPKLPRLYGMTGYDRLYFFQKDPDTFIQLKRTISNDIINFDPVESDIKYGAILSIQRIRQLTQRQTFLQKYGSHLVIIIAMVLLLVMLSMILEKFDPTLMQKISEQNAKVAEKLAEVSRNIKG